MAIKNLRWFCWVVPPQRETQVSFCDRGFFGRLYLCRRIILWRGDLSKRRTAPMGGEAALRQLTLYI
jgi:hypothetical protein